MFGVKQDSAGRLPVPWLLQGQDASFAIMLGDQMSQYAKSLQCHFRIVMLLSWSSKDALFSPETGALITNIARQHHVFADVVQICRALGWTPPRML